MKIGIITFHNSDNYGAVLQTFALLRTLKKLNNEVYIIDYVCKAKIDQYKILAYSKNNSLKSNIGGILNAPFKYKKRKLINKFTEKRYELTTNKFYSVDEIESANLNYDMYICGSDQVWNYENTKFDKAYFLDFESDECKKMSYAASFGVSNIDERYESEYKKLINNIKFLSTREESGKNIINKLTARECSVVLDPTFLLCRDDWFSYCEEIKNKYEDYILIYTLHNRKEIINIANKISEKSGYKIIKISTLSFKDYFNGIKTVIPGPLEFINLIKNAKYVITDSFHGVAFSINLNTNFFTYLGNGINTHSRINDLLTKCKLEDRVILENSELSLEDIDFSYSNNVLAQERKKSMGFIVNSLGQYNSYNEKEIIM